MPKRIGDKTMLIMPKQTFGNPCPVCGGDVEVIDSECILEYTCICIICKRVIKYRKF